ncbi:MAG: hypothetical protein V3S51_04410, partial [Dehalococcoidia bacterium]
LTGVLVYHFTSHIVAYMSIGYNERPFSDAGLCPLLPPPRELCSHDPLGAAVVEPPNRNLGGWVEVRQQTTSMKK